MFVKLLMIPGLFMIVAIITAFALAFAKTPEIPDFTTNPSLIDSGDTAWMLTSSAFVMLMSFPGLAVFYGGLASKNNDLSTIQMTCATYCIVSVLWILYGYSFAFGPDQHGVLGDSSKVFMHGVGPYSTHEAAPTIPEYVYCVFQLTFAAISCALASGGYIERMKFIAWVLFSVMWLTLVYVPVSHWVWGGGFLGEWGVLDFAGGTVVHINAGVSALVGALFLGPRKNIHVEPGNLQLFVVGTGLLWFGWFGFNAGSACSSGGLAASAWINTNTATAAAAISWMLVEYLNEDKATIYGLCTGAVSGLVGITPASGFVNVAGSLYIGMAAGIVPYYFVAIIKPKLGFDDALDAFSIHAISGTIGSLATGMLADPNINPVGTGFIYGNYDQIGKQLVADLVTWIYSGLITCLIFFILEKTIKIRITEEEEKQGTDVVNKQRTNIELTTLSAL